MKKVLTVVLLLLASLGGVIVWWQMRQPGLGEQTMTMPDGSTLRIIRMSYGTNHVYVDGTFWQQFLCKLPAPLTARFINRPPTINQTAPSPSIMLWYEWTGRLPGTTPPRLSIESSDGMFSGPVYASTTTLGAPPRELSGFHLEAFPRRDKSFTVHLFGYDRNYQNERITSITVPNPAPFDPPPWNPGPLPQTAVNGDLEVTLRRVLANVNLDGRREPAAPEKPWKTGTMVWLDYKQNGQTVHHWKIEAVECSDATGNRRSSTAHYNSPGTNDWDINFASILWPNEPWKLRLELIRTNHFAPDELVHFQGITNGTPAGAHDEILAEGMASGRRVTMFRHFRDGGGSNHSTDNRTSVIHFNIEPPLKGVRFYLVNAINEKNQKLRSGGWGMGGNQGDCTISLVGPPSKRLDVTLAVQKSRFVEFTVQPEVFTNSAEAR